MSRTYRTQIVAVCGTCGKPPWTNKTVKFNNDMCSCREEQDHFGWRQQHYKPMKLRDNKPWSKPPHEHKKRRSRRRRAQAKQALHNHVWKGKEYLPPTEKNGDQWDWM